MSTTIQKPSSASRRWRATRRKRVRLPEEKFSKHGTPSATYGRDNPVKSRSKYSPHVGKKQLARKA